MLSIVCIFSDAIVVMGTLTSPLITTLPSTLPPAPEPNITNELVCLEPASYVQ